MDIFSRAKRAKKTAHPDKTATPTDRCQISPPSPQHGSTYAVRDSHPAEPIILTAEEVRARIAENIRRRSELARNSIAQSSTHTRSISDGSIPGAGWQTHRGRNLTLVNATIQDIPIQEEGLVPPPLFHHGSDPINKYWEPRMRRQRSEEFYSNPRTVPLPPRMKMDTALPAQNRSRRLTKRRSPLSMITGSDDIDEYLSTSSRDTTRHSGSSTASTAPSTVSSGRAFPSSSAFIDGLIATATSASSLHHERRDTKRSSSLFPNFSRVLSVNSKKQPVLDISLPYSSFSSDTSDDEGVKTAKSQIPAWRYDDLRTDNELPTHVASISPTHSRVKSYSPVFLPQNHAMTIA